MSAMGQERQFVPPSLMTAAPSTAEVASGAGTGTRSSAPIVPMDDLGVPGKFYSALRSACGIIGARKLGDRGSGHIRRSSEATAVI